MKFVFYMSFMPLCPCLCIFARVCSQICSKGNKRGLNPYVLMFLPFDHTIVYLVSSNSLILYAIYMYELSLFMYLLFLVLFMSFIYLSTIYWHVLLTNLSKLFFSRV